MKPWYKSKTIMLNLVATIAAGIVAALPQLQGLMTPQNFAIASTVLGVANIGLRFITTQPLTTDKE